VAIIALSFGFVGCGDGNGKDDLCKCDPKEHYFPCDCGGTDCTCVELPMSWNGIPVYLDGGTAADWIEIKVHLDFYLGILTDKQKENIKSFLTIINIKSSGGVSQNGRILNIAYNGELPPYYDGTYHNRELLIAFSQALSQVASAYEIWNSIYISDYPNTTNMEAQWTIIKGWLNAWYEAQVPAKQETFKTRIENIIIWDDDTPGKDGRPILWIGEDTNQSELIIFLDKLVTQTDTWNGIPVYIDDYNISTWNRVKDLLDTLWETLNDTQKAKFSTAVKMINAASGSQAILYGIMLSIGESANTSAIESAIAPLLN
jgi:hypothetical protein